ncbi:unnamed protein product [Allacma fusca]|uniref:Uncharacterized protein n=1 Tax=Allacma fusca TaxID=39272 RepID=A0A8J2KES0_9HEXA|nr:unnamed protein product [Allacma fusca]
MSNKVIVALATFAMVALSLGLSKQEDQSLGKRDAVNKIREAIIQQDVQVGMNRQGRIFLSNGLFGNLFNLSAILASAPENTTSLTFLPLATILFGNKG